MRMSRKHAIEVLERSNAILKLQLAKLSAALDEVDPSNFMVVDHK